MESDKESIWVNARDLYRDLAIPEFHIRFEDWFTTRIQSAVNDAGVLLYKINKDWRHEGEGETLKLMITQRVADEVAGEEIGPKIEKVGSWSHEAADMGWNQETNPQTHAITGDEELLK